MNEEIEQFSAINPNPVLSIAKDGKVTYSNKAGEALLHEWGVKVGEKLPSSILYIVQRVISHNNPEKLEVKAGNRVYLVVFLPSTERECVNISGFDISDQKDIGEKANEGEVQKIAKVEFAEIIDIRLIKSLMDDFHELFNISVGLIDLKGNILINVGWQDICVNFHRIHPDSFKHCVESETKVTADILQGEIRPCRCKNNMWHIATPIMVGSQQVGYICAGQFLFDDEPPDYDLFRSQAKKYGFNEGEYIGALKRVPLVNRKNINICISFLSKLANMISQLSHSNIKLAKSLVERDTLFEALQESEDRFRSVLDSSLDAAYRRDLQTDSYDYMSPVIEQITGFSSIEISAMSTNEALDHVHPYDRPRVASELFLSLHAGSGTFDYRFKCKDGNYRWLADYFKVIKDQNSSPQYISGVVRDITERKQAEEALAFERSQLLSIFDGIDDVVYVTDPYTYEVLYANKAMKEKFGSELLGGICYQEFQRRDSPCDFCTNPIISKERGKPYHWEYYNPNVDRYFMIMDRIIKWPDGRDVRFEIAKDITERKRIEEALRESEEKYRELFESNVDGIIVTDLEGNILKVNPTYEKMLGYSIEELRHLSYQQLTPARWHESEAHIVREQVFEHGYSDEYEKEYTRKDGSIFPISIRVWLSVDKQGRPQGMWGIVRDITERKKTEEALREIEERRKVAEAVEAERQRLFDVLETLPTMVYLLTPNHHIAFANRRFREKFGESGGRKCYECCFRRTKPCEFCEAYKVLETGKPHNWEAVTSDGSVFDVYSFPFTDVDGSPMIVKMKIDITERRKAEEALEKIEIARKKEIHHRIKNNLQVISSLLDLQAQQFKNKKDIKDSEILEAFRESQARVISMALIHEELYKGGGFETLNFSPYIEKLIENLFQNYRIGDAEISLKMDLVENAFFDMDTAIPLGIIINELVSNSFKHAFSGKNEGEIQIKLQREENGECIKGIKEDCSNTFVLTISDNGIGIPEDLEIEELDSLGFQLVTILVDQLDGEFELKRNNGTEFTMRFKVTEKDNQAMTNG